MEIEELNSKMQIQDVTKKKIDTKGSFLYDHCWLCMLIGDGILTPAISGLFLILSFILE